MLGLRLVCDAVVVVAAFKLPFTLPAPLRILFTHKIHAPGSIQNSGGANGRQSFSAAIDLDRRADSVVDGREATRDDVVLTEEYQGAKFTRCHYIYQVLEIR